MKISKNSCTCTCIPEYLFANLLSAISFVYIVYNWPIGIDQLAYSFLRRLPFPLSAFLGCLYFFVYGWGFVDNTPLLRETVSQPTPDPLALIIILSSLQQWSLSLRERLSDTDVSFRVGCFTVGLIVVGFSLLISIYWIKRELLWWGLRDALIYVNLYIIKNPFNTMSIQHHNISRRSSRACGMSSHRVLVQ